MTAARRERVLAYVILVVGAITVLVPLFNILSVALQPPGTLISGLHWPSHPRWSNFADAWSTGTFGPLLKNSAIIALVVVPCATAVSVLAGYAFGCMQFRGSSVIFYLMLIGIVMPFEATIVPLYYDLRTVGLTSNFGGVILPEIALYICFGAFWMRSFFKTVPTSLLEAARLDGANSFTTLIRVLLPLARPAVTTLAVLFFIWSWNEFLLALVMLQDPAQRTAPSGLGVFVGQFTSNVSGLSAGALLIVAPVIVVYVLLQRRVISGMLQGAVKE